MWVKSQWNKFGWKIFFFFWVILFRTRKSSNKSISLSSIVYFKIFIRFLYAQKKYNASFVVVRALCFFYSHYANNTTSVSHEWHWFPCCRHNFWSLVKCIVSFEGNFLSRQPPVLLCFQDPNVACSRLLFTLMYLMPWLRCNVQQLLFLIPRYFTISLPELPSIALCWLFVIKTDQPFYLSNTGK